MTQPLNFDAAKENGGDSWSRADPRTATIQRLTFDQYGVALPDGDDAHVVTLRHEGQGYLGECDCKGYKFSSGPCAHLTTLRKAEFIGEEQANGDPVVIPDEVDRYDHHIEQSADKARTDGGDPR